MNISARDRRAVLTGALLLVAIFVVRYAVMPWIDHWTDVRAAIDVDHRRLVDIERQTRRVELLDRQLDRTYGSAARRPLEDVPATQVAFHKTVKQVLTEAGIGFERIDEQSVRPLKRVPGTVLVALQVRGRCKIDQLAKFLARTHQADMLILVERISASKRSDKPDQLDVVLVLTTLAEKRPAGRRAT
ncbi:MAG: hypothetical protein CMJ18_13945 [Phycisphaeraceae bacterium]|nr:hypothetical protein [Phycisphaeraceae bacterium]